MLGRNVYPKLRRNLMWAALVGGPVFLLISLGFAVHTSVFLWHSDRTTGTVVKLLTRTDSHGGTSYIPVFEFRARDGENYVVASHFATNPPLFTVGENIPVVYEPGQPQTATPDSFWPLWVFSVVFGVLGVLLASGGLLLRRFSKQRAMSRAG